MIKTELVTSEIWHEESHPEDPFVANSSLCCGYDVYDELIRKADMTDYLFLLFFGEKPTARDKGLLNALAVILGNPGPRDLSVRAAMTAGAGGSSPAACLISALGTGSGNFNGSHEIQIITALINQHADDLSMWQDYLSQDFPLTQPGSSDVLLPIEHPPGFSYQHQHISDMTLNSLKVLAAYPGTRQLNWLLETWPLLMQAAGGAMQLSFVIANAFNDLNLDEEQSEFIYLLLRLPGAAAHALEQRRRGWRDYPFHHGGIRFNIEEPNHED